MKNRIIKVINIVLIIVFVILLCPKTMQNDTLWSIKQGEDIVNYGIREFDDWSIHENLRTISHHYTLDIAIHFIYSTCGFFGLYIMEIIFALVITALLYKINSNFTKNEKLAYAFLYMQMFFLMPFISVRAQMVSMIVFLIEFLVLEKAYKQLKIKHVIILGIVLPLILANLHMGVLPFYFIIQGVYLVASVGINNKNIIAEKKLKTFKWLAISETVGIAVIFINPYGLDGVTYGFKTIFSQTLGAIQEFKPLSFEQGWGLLIFIYTLCIITIAIINKKFYLKDILLVLGTFFMTCISLRHMMYYIIFSSVVLAYIDKINIQFRKEDLLAIEATKYILITILILVFLCIRIGDNQYINEKEYPVKAYEKTKQYFNSETRIFNDWSWGSYLKFNEEKVFIDSRGDLYTEEYNKGVTIFKDYLDAEKKYKEVIEKYDVNMFLIKPDTPLATILSVDETFDEIYKDDVACVYVKVK